MRDELASIKDYFSDNEGEGFAVLAEPSSSPSRESLKNQFKLKYPKAQWVEYSPSLIGNVSSAASIVYGTSLA